MRHAKLIGVAMMMALVLFGAGETGFSEEYERDAEEAQVAHTRGLRFHIAEDRQMQQIGESRVEPEGLDMYMKRKFDALSAQLAQIQAKFDRLEESVKRCGPSAAAPAAGQEKKL